MMKKMIQMLAVVLAVGFANAASINWGLQNGRTLSDSIGDAGTAYLVFGDITAASNWADKESFSAADIAAAGGSVIASGSYASSTFSASGTITQADVGNDGGAVKATDIYLVFIDSAGENIAVSNKKSIRVNDASSIPLNATWNSTTLTYYAAVPEPTAIALLLMGVAAVGLKRRA